jgi:RimJ/RimL family protein N-acetyltransferase
MQQAWRTDADKLTFITCLSSIGVTKTTTIDEGIVNLELQDRDFKLKLGVEDASDRMIGDVNLFLYPDEEDEEQRLDQTKSGEIIPQEANEAVGEVEIMIARKEFQGKGYGRQILLGFLWYIVKSYPEIMHEYHQIHGGKYKRSCLNYLRVKIDAENLRSLRLFESIGFTRLTEKPNYFGELELRLPWSEDMGQTLEQMMKVVPLDIDYE